MLHPEHRTCRRVLLVEDDPNDAFFFIQTNPWRDEVGVSHVGGADEAKRYLLREGKYQDAVAFPPPDAILTDLKMPICNGVELIRWIRQRSQFNRIPCVVLSSSSIGKDIEDAKSAGAADYLIKPVDIAEYRGVWDAFLAICRRNGTAPHAG